MLSPQAEKFVMSYICGDDDVRGNGTAAYFAAYPTVRSYGAAAASASRLLKRDDVRARIREVRRQAEREARARLRSWWSLAPAAQNTLEAAAAGSYDPMPDAPHGVRAEAIRSGVRAASEILSRAEGTPQQMHELRLEAGITVQVAGPSLHNGHYLPSSSHDRIRSGLEAGARAPQMVDVPSLVENDATAPQIAAGSDPAGQGDDQE